MGEQERKQAIARAEFGNTAGDMTISKTIFMGENRSLQHILLSGEGARRRPVCSLMDLL